MKWIPTSERLPEPGNTVLFWDQEYSQCRVGRYLIEGRFDRRVASWVDDGGYGEERGFRVEDVPAWAELPEPYSSKNGEHS